MKLELLMNSLENLRLSSENGDYELDMIRYLIIKDLLDYIDNPRVDAKVDEIVF